jgi:hypothetical protein
MEISFIDQHPRVIVSFCQLCTFPRGELINAISFSASFWFTFIGSSFATVTNWKRVLLVNFIITQLLKKFLAFFWKVSIPRSQKPAINSILSHLNSAYNIVFHTFNIPFNIILPFRDGPDYRNSIPGKDKLFFCTTQRLDRASGTTRPPIHWAMRFFPRE